MWTTADRPATFTVRVRLPNRAESALYAATPEVSHGHQDFTVALTRQADGSISSKSIRFELPMPLQHVTCDKRVKANRGLVAWQRGPIVFSWEGPRGGSTVGPGVAATNSTICCNK